MLACSVALDVFLYFKPGNVKLKHFKLLNVTSAPAPEIRTCGINIVNVFTWLWVNNRYLKWSPGKWSQGLKPSVHILVV